MTSVASAEPVKIALIETLSGPASLTGKLMQGAVKFGLAKLVDERVWPDGVEVARVRQPRRAIGGSRQAQDRHQ